MATGQSVLNIMEDLNGELQLQSGEGDVAKGLRALNAAQDLVETVLAMHSQSGYSSNGTVAVSANVENTAYPTGLLRLDSLWLINATTSRPEWKLKPLRESGGHASGTGWLSGLALGTTTGKPRAYWTDASFIFWEPLPQAAYTVRWYGLKQAADVTAGGTFAYQDTFIYPLATLASRIMKTTLDDPPEDMLSLAEDLFNPLIEAATHFNRDGAVGMVYEHYHDT